MSKLENSYQKLLIKKLKKMFIGCVILKNDPSYIQGIPDLLILYKNKWAALECKRDKFSVRQPNQEWWTEHLNSLSFARFIYPDNEKEVLNELQQTFLD